MKEQTRKRISAVAWLLTLACPLLAIFSSSMLSGGWAVAAAISAIVAGVLAVGVFAATYRAGPGS